MIETEEKLEKLKNTIEKYRKNKTQIPPEELAGKYKVPFERLEWQLKLDLASYLKAYSLACLGFFGWSENERDDFAKEFCRIYHAGNFGLRVGQAALEKFDIDQVQALADELRGLVVDAWAEYAEQHMNELVSGSR